MSLKKSVNTVATGSNIVYGAAVIGGRVLKCLHFWVQNILVKYFRIRLELLRSHSNLLHLFDAQVSMAALVH